jgi:ribonuclease Y
MQLNDILIIIGAVVVGALVSQLIFRRLKFIDIDRAKEKAEKIMSKSRDEAQKILDEAEKNAEGVKKNIHETERQMKSLIRTIEKNVSFKENALAKKENRNKQYRDYIDSLEKEIKETENKYEEIEKEVVKKLADRLGTSTDNLAVKIVEDYKKQLKDDAIEKIKRAEEYAHENAERTAKNILRGAMQRFTDRTSVEKKEAKIIVKRESTKSHLVGRNAENIMLFEKLMDVDVIFNDEPKTILVSSFDLVKKNIARIALGKLVKVRRIDERSIKKAIQDAKKIIEKDLFNVGLKAVKKMRFKQKFPDELIKTIGRLKYRTSYGQNILLHSFEVAYMAELLASELKLDADLTKAAAFFHDIGKAIDQEVEGSHDYLTREIMTKYNFSKEEIHAAWTHHEAETPDTPEARIVMAADAISAGRPGARQESLERYLERLSALEKIATSFTGVQKTYAISAGRELRVLVSSEEVNDDEIKKLADKIAHQVENKLNYPGKIKINIIRRTRSVDYAK